MSVLFGIQQDGVETVNERALWALAQRTSRYSADGCSVKTSGATGMGFQPYYTHARSHEEQMPWFDEYGNLLALDGRIDNFRDLADALDIEPRSTRDSEIVFRGFQKWGSGLFSRLSGEWALALWLHSDQRLYLARDHAGSRTLFYRQTNGTLVWSTLLEAFFQDGEAIPLNRDFAARYLACLPLRDITPYEGIQAVLPAHFLSVARGRISQHAHWDWMPQDGIHYHDDSEYEQHFRFLFKQAVGRRTTDGAPILAQLSGGIDSSSIVCMSDCIRREGGEKDLLDTVSFYDDTEPSWNERPYFEAIEKHRGKRGHHVDAAVPEMALVVESHCGRPTLFPTAQGTSDRQQEELMAIYDRGSFRSVLSGVGGDEMLGGIPDALPELIDLFRSRQLKLFLKTAIDWCLVDRSPLISTIVAVSTGALTDGEQKAAVDLIPPWIDRGLSGRCLEFLETDVAHQRISGLSAVSIDNGLSWWSLIESLPHLRSAESKRLEYRYPYLDKDLVNYLFRIPREQIARPGQRRSLMRRGLKNIVPSEVLNRRRKAFRIRGPLLTLQQSQGELDKLLSKSCIARFGLVEEEGIRAGLRQITAGSDIRWWLPMMRAVALERWLENSSRYVRL